MTTDSRHDIARRLPSVDRLLNEQPLKDIADAVPRSIIVKAARKSLDRLRSRILDGWMPSDDDLSPTRVAEQASELALRLSVPSMKRVINATGVVLNTGLGRAVLPEAARKAVDAVASGHSNLEVSMETGGRGSRGSHYRRLLAELCGAESAFAVNNNAAAVFLVLNTLAFGREVIVSRGQLVEIGGSFRLPDIMTRAGARLVEVGTTNRTRISDYEKAITEDTALILRVHPSNFRIIGYAEEASIEQMAELGCQYGIAVVDDLGSGSLVDMSRFGLQGEQTVQDSMKAGADIVTFSGDKLLGGPQAGLIAGNRTLIEELRTNPLARALRIGKLTVAALESTLRLYTDPDTVKLTIPTLRYLSRPIAEIEQCASLLADQLRGVMNGVSIDVTDGCSEVGGGSLPGEHLPTKLVALSSTEPGLANPMDLARAFRTGDPPVFGRVGENRFLLDMRTVEESDIADIVRGAQHIICT